MSTQPDPGRWTPFRVSLAEDPPLVHWCMTADADFTEPFFEETIAAQLRRPFNQVFRRTTTVTELDPDLPALPLAGLVLHVSRCGSTLLAQALAASVEVLSLSEPAPLDSVTRADLTRDLAGGSHERWVAAVYRALAQPRRPQHRWATVKTDAWTVHRLPLLRRVFPEVPWVLLIRDPVEVAVSQLQRRGAHMVPGALPAELLDTDPGLPPEQYVASVLGSMLSAGAAYLDGKALVLDHSQLHQGGLDAVFQHFGLDRPDLGAVQFRHAKDPARDYRPDGADRRQAATREVVAAVEAQARGPYEALLAQAAAC